MCILIMRVEQTFPLKELIQNVSIDDLTLRLLEFEIELLFMLCNGLRAKL